VFRKSSEDISDIDEYFAAVNEKLLEARRNDDPNITVNVKEDGDIYDTMDYEFIPDEEALGEWEAVDFLRKIDDFDPEEQYWQGGNLFWKYVKFYEDGTVISNLRIGQWTKGYIWQNDTIPSYTIKNIDGEKYMFIQWKSGDYTIRRTKPLYYVFKKIG